MRLNIENIKDKNGMAVLPTKITLTFSSSGAKGLPGLSAYEIAQNNGYVGTEEEWLQSLKPNLEEELGDYKIDLALRYQLSKL